jgi:hypothetical protein
MNWGHKIAVLYISFVVLILTMVFLANKEKVDLVTSDYYEQELRFQDKINAGNNAKNLTTPINFETKNRILHLIYPKEMLGKTISGDITLYRPSDAALDYKTTININADGGQTISSLTFKRGLYKMQFSWRMDNLDYYIEEPVFMN